MPSPPDASGADGTADVAPSRAGTVLDPTDVRRVLRRVVSRSLREDLIDGSDPVADAVVGAHARGGAQVVARQPGLLAGSDAVVETYAQIDRRVTVERYRHDGDELQPGTLVAAVDGPLRSILVGARSLLDLLGHLSGVATSVRSLVDAAEGLPVHLARTATPTLRTLETWAALLGGADLLDADTLVLDDNHRVAVGGVGEAVTAAIEHGSGARILVEVVTAEELDAAVEAGADGVLLRNVGPNEAGQLVDRAARRLRVEVSGTLAPDELGAYVRAGVRGFHLAAVTSMRWLDLGLEVVEEPLFAARGEDR